MPKKMPKTIYVKWEHPSNDEAYLVAGTEFDGMVELGGQTVVGTYQLVETATAEMVVKTSTRKKSR